MSSVLKKLKIVQAGKPYNGFQNLSIGYHQIQGFRMTKNRFAKKDEDANTIIVELTNEILFLPQYFSETLNEEDIDDLNSSIRSGVENMYLYFGGKREKSR